MDMVRRVICYWIACVLVVARLLAGDVAHAVSFSEQHATVRVANSSADKRACPEHANMQHGMASEDNALAHEDQGSTKHGGGDCCKDSACKCPCAHVSPLTSAMEFSGANFFLHTAASYIHVARACDRHSTQFKPPT